MKCFFCGVHNSRVVDSRIANNGAVVRRRRKCGSCGNRFTTYEKVEEMPLVVIKRDGRREVFDRKKIFNGLLLAGQKRPIPLAVFKKIVEELEQRLRSSFMQEISTDMIGDILMHELRKVDEVAYVRFASVFRKFENINAFKDELEKMLYLKQQESGNAEEGQDEKTTKRQG